MNYKFPPEVEVYQFPENKEMIETAESLSAADGKRISINGAATFTDLMDDYIIPYLVDIYKQITALNHNAIINLNNSTMVGNIENSLC